MNLVADEGVDHSIVGELRAAGHTVGFIAESNRGADDVTVLQIARESKAVLVTSDKDFGELVYRQRMSSHGVLLLRLAGLTAIEKANLVATTVDRHGGQLVGSFSVLTPKMVRIRSLEPDYGSDS